MGIIAKRLEAGKGLLAKKIVNGNPKAIEKGNVIAQKNPDLFRPAVKQVQNVKVVRKPFTAATLVAPNKRMIIEPAQDKLIESATKGSPLEEAAYKPSPLEVISQGGAPSGGRGDYSEAELAELPEETLAEIEKLAGEQEEGKDYKMYIIIVIVILVVLYFATRSK